MSKQRKISLASAFAVFGLAFLLSGTAMADMPRRDGGEFMPMRAIHDKLQLTPEQEKTWQSLAQESRALREASRKERGEMQAALKQELDKGAPDFAALAARADRQADEHSAKNRHVRDAWIKFYATLTPAQQATAREMLKARLDKAGKRWERMKQREERSRRN